MLLVGLVVSLGGMLLTALFTPKKPDTYGSRLSDINVTSVSPGQPIIQVWGTMKLPTQMIFASELIETMHTHQASKKGGGGKGMLTGNAVKNYTFTYSVDGAWGVCAGPVYQLNRVWANQKLLYVNPIVAATSNQAFDAAYQSEATRLIDEEGVSLDYAAASAFVFAFNNFDTTEVTLSSPADAVGYIMAHPIVDEAPADPGGIFDAILYPDSAGVTNVISQLYSGLNNQDQYEQQINRFDLIEVYLGDDEQAPNGLLEGYLGAGNAPAFRNCCYFVITNLQLMDFGNNVPSITAEVQTTPGGTTTLIDVMQGICLQAGLTVEQFQFNFTDTIFPGFCVTTVTSARQILQDLQKVFPINGAESGYKIVFGEVNVRASQILQRGDFGAHADTDPLPVREQIQRTSDYDLPQRIDLKYQEPARNYSPNELYAARYNTPSTLIEKVDLTIALDRADAQGAVIQMLANRMFARKIISIQLPRKYITLEPTDVVKVQNKYNTELFDEYLCTQLEVGANGLIKAQFVDHYYVDPSVNPSQTVGVDISSGSGAGATVLPGTSSTFSYLYDCPLLTDSDADVPGFYVILAGSRIQWQGGTLFVDAAAPSVSQAYGQDIINPSSGSAWQGIATSQVNVPHGVALDALAPGMNPCYWDRESSIVVRIINGMGLVSATESDLLFQALNVTFIGQELVQFANAQNLGNGLFRLTTFMRGLRGTERLMDTHVTGEDFVRVTEGYNRVITTLADLNQTDTFHDVSINSNAADQISFTFSDTGNSFRPYTVHVTQKFRATNGDITVAWVPRTRQNGQWLSGGDITLPANDLPETYSVDVLSAPNGTVLNTYPLVPSVGALGYTWDYTHADQEADYSVVSPPAEVYLVIYQISQKVGRGFPIGIQVP
jgi:hypothetical protein